MGACLAKTKAIVGKDQSQDAEQQLGKASPISVPQSPPPAKTSTASDVTPKKRSDSFRSKGLVGKVFGHDSDSKPSKGGKGGSRARLSKDAVVTDRPLQAMSSAELVEQYSIDASILVSSAERIDKVRLTAVRFVPKIR